MQLNKTGVKLCMFFSLIFIACQPADVTLQPTVDLLPATQEAVALWNPVLAKCGRHFSTTADDPYAYILWGRPGGQEVLGDTHQPGLEITKVFLDPLLAADQALLLRTLAHELGHVLGAPESDQRGDVMYPDDRDGTTVTITAHDAELVGCRD